MKIFFCITALTVIVFIAGCSSLSIHHDVDKNADFSAFKTYSWADSTGTGTRNDGTIPSSDGSIAAFIETETNRLLTEKGLEFDYENPDLLVKYHTGSESKIDVTGYGYSYGGDYSGWQDAGIGIYPYHEGTLVIDLVDARTKILVWRGVAQGVIVANTQKNRNKIATQALEEMFEKYPPHQ